jgi:hypothetical protein
MNEEQNERRDQPVEIERVEVVKEIIMPDKVVIVDEIIDIEVFAKQKKKPPHAKGYRIRIDKEYFVVHVPHMTGREILALVKKTPEEYQLSEKLHSGQVVPVKAEQEVDFRHHEIERFHTIALDPTEGSGHAS